jgi:hypothetical protein
VRLTEHQVVEWLKERSANCTRLAVNKTAEDKKAWEEDAAYFRAAVLLILGITDQDIAESEWPRQ